MSAEPESWQNAPRLDASLTSAGQREAKQSLNPKPAPRTEDEKMLLALRDELYEGDWALMVADLEARLNNEPYVFEIGLACDRLKETITGHLRIIESLQAREVRLGIDPDAAPGSPP